MATSVETGHTKSASGISLFSQKYKSNLKESVIFLMQIHADTTDAKNLMKECETMIKHSLLETDGDAGDRLDGTLKEINGLLKGFLVAKTIDDIHAIIAIQGLDDMLSVSHAGTAEGYIIRGGQASQITEYTRGKTTPAFIHIASGSIESRDVVVFSTQRLLRTVTPAQLAKLSQRGDQLIEELTAELESEKEKSALAVIRSEARKGEVEKKVKALPPRSSRRRRRRSPSRIPQFSGVADVLISVSSRVRDSVPSFEVVNRLRELPSVLLADMKNPKKKKKAHMLTLAGVVVVFLVVWAVVNLATTTQNGQSRAELEQMIEQVDTDIKTAENRYLAGDTDSANTILERAEATAKQVMDHESGRYRMEALDLLDRIRLKNEDINNITRFSPRVVVNLSAKNSDVSATGMIGLKDGELIVHDKQDLYRVVLNAVDEPDRLAEEELIVDGDFFDRMQTLLFQLSDNSIVEIINGQTTSMKTEDPAGWIAGSALKTYLRFLYVLSPENNQIYKYERLSNRYSAPSEYNINGDLGNALDFAIDGNVYVLKEGGEIVKLFRGESRPFVIRHLPEGALEGVTRIYKSPEDGNLYLLNSEGSRIIVATDGGATGESAYIRQYILEGEQVGELKDLYVGPEQLRMYVIDGKRVYAVDLVATR
ncbi:MAG: hypothetical protein QF741_04000 [Candidatus Peribacteraceae bacterium]|jgi:hypothetical protein|nr:hypothetical protein [Candidatus Peribacteraceae bacterium]|tara:strand:+ start:1232 stop:3190 length:1959 start_codon:yes stop_codon:yes gene_type:complete